MSFACNARGMPTAGRITYYRSPERFRNRTLSVLVALIASGLVTTLPTPSLAQAVHLVEVDVKVVAKGYRASKLIGQNVVNDKDETIGEIDDLIVDQKNTIFAILVVGSFLGIGGHLVALPFDSFKLDDSGKKVTLSGGSKDSLEKLQEFKYEK
jgi:sporulation protein YlmC with PRC-barrel domain